MCLIIVYLCFFFKRKTAYELRINYWSSDVCSSDLTIALVTAQATTRRSRSTSPSLAPTSKRSSLLSRSTKASNAARPSVLSQTPMRAFSMTPTARRSEEHTSELQSLMRISYAVFCLKKKKPPQQEYTQSHNS